MLTAATPAAPPVAARADGPSLPAARIRPSAPSRAFARWAVEPTASTVPLVRARVRTLLESWRITADLVDTLLLAVSELVGNVVRHASAAGRMRVAVFCGAGWLRLEVADGTAALPRLPTPAVEADPEAEGGRGLLLVQLLAAEAGGELAVVTAEFGKSVRLRVPLA
ncbi:ATP-binding protein [Streptomyces sp. NPDC008121]|uniref:ATP-binding protein n=1 Tax=Streptomyces sp. NPDC008121 TaxID=3364809 RepID=UPI0036E78CA1